MEDGSSMGLSFTIPKTYATTCKHTAFVCTRHGISYTIHDIYNIIWHTIPDICMHIDVHTYYEHVVLRLTLSPSNIIRYNVIQYHVI